MHRVAFSVDDIDEAHRDRRERTTVTRCAACATYGDVDKLTYVRGPAPSER